MRPLFLLSYVLSRGLFTKLLVQYSRSDGCLSFTEFQTPKKGNKGEEGHQEFLWSLLNTNEEDRNLGVMC